jgi:hypothetical protein
MPRSFAELESDENVRAYEVADVLEHYALSGAAISGAVVIALIERTNPSYADRQTMILNALRGRDSQSRRRFHKDAAEYQKVLDRLHNST